MRKKNSIVPLALPIALDDAANKLAHDKDNLTLLTSLTSRFCSFAALSLLNDEQLSLFLRHPFTHTLLADINLLLHWPDLDNNVTFLWERLQQIKKLSTEETRPSQIEFINSINHIYVNLFSLQILQLSLSDTLLHRLIKLSNTYCSI